jgi:osomolarity two-component system response regulator SSK1
MAETPKPRDHVSKIADITFSFVQPVNFVWLERKVMEWGCMQALIDFDGWRKWKDFSLKADEAEAARKSAKGKKSKNRLSTTVSSSAT